MTIDVDSIPGKDQTLMLAFLAHELTVCARGTYEAGTDRVLEPENLRRFNELQHRVTGAVRDHLNKKDGIPFSAIIEMVRGFGEETKRVGEMEWALQRAAELTLHFRPHVP